MKEVHKIIDGMPKIRKYIIDGELAGRTWQQTMTLFRSSKADVSDELKEDGRYKIFDMIDPDNLDERYEDRQERLIEAFANVQHPMIALTKTVNVSSYEEFNDAHQFNLASGCDGSIIKLLSGGYEFKRSKLWLKVKPLNEVDCKIVGFKEGKGKYVGMLGSLEIQFKIGKRWSRYTTSVSGMDDADRVRMWRDRKKLLGGIVEVSYRKISEKERLVEARVYRPRPDKEDD